MSWTRVWGAVLAVVLAVGLLSATTGAAGAAGAADGPAYEREWAFGGTRDDIAGVAVSGEHVFVVGEPGVMKRFTKDGTLTGSWELGYQPRGLAAGPDGQLHVTQGWQPQQETTYVHVYDAAGNPVRTYTLGEGVTWFPGSITVDGAGNSYVTSHQDDTRGVHRFDSRGAYTGTLDGAFGLTFEQSAVGAAPDGTLYVADVRNHRIVRFATDGTTTQWGQSGYADGQFMFPSDVAVLPSGNVLVTDVDTSRLQELTPQGVFVRHVGAGRLRENHAVTVDADGTVYVGGYLASLLRGVAKFSPAGASPPPPPPATQPPPEVPGEAGTTPVARLAGKQLRVRGGKVVVRLRCRGDAPCRGSLEVRRGKKSLAKGGYRVAAGKRKAFRVKLTKRGRAAARRTPVAVVVVFETPAGNEHLAQRARLRR